MAAVIEFQHVTKIYKRIFSEEKLAALVTRDSMIGVAKVTAPGGQT